MSNVKHPWAAVLLVLCIGLWTGAAVAADSWAPTDNTLPSALTWDQVHSAAIDATNDGTTPWDSTYSIESVAGTGAEAAKLDRWETTSVASGSVAPTASTTLFLSLVAPPISTLTYALPITPTRVAATAALDCNWMLAKDGTLFTDLPAVENPITITRFPDTAPGTAGAWAAGYVEECAGRVPLIVGGYPDGSYGSSIAVTRDQMAVFIQRAMELPLGSNDGHFVDVPIGYWAGNQIQSCVDAGIVGGYDPTHYVPLNLVTRDQMAVFVARAMAGGDSGVPSGPPTATFPDVPVGYWAFKHVEYAVAHSVVGGYPDGNYWPGNQVTRDQMAVFVYRAAIQPTGAVVVLAGPAVTSVAIDPDDPNGASYDGWSTAAVGEAADPGLAYLGFDAVRAPAADIDVTFELRDAASPTTPATGDYTYSTRVLVADLATKKASAELDGDPYIYTAWDIPAGLTEGDYVLVTTVNGIELTRKPDLYIGPPPPVTLVAEWNKERAVELMGAEPDNGNVSDSAAYSGTPDDMAATDGVYFVSRRSSLPPTAYCNRTHGHAVIWHGVPPSAQSMTVTVTYHVERGVINCCAADQELAAWETPPPDPSTQGYVQPCGWGLRVMSGADPWEMQWFESVHGTNPKQLGGSGDQHIFASNDVQGGDGDGIGFTGHPQTDATYTWTTTDVPKYSTDGDVMLTFCGGGYQYLYIDQATLTYQP